MKLTDREKKAIESKVLFGCIHGWISQTKEEVMDIADIIAKDIIKMLEKEIYVPVDKRWSVAQNKFSKEEILKALDIYSGIKEGKYTVFDEEGGQV